MKGIKINKRPLKMIRARHLAIPTVIEDVKDESIVSEEVKVEDEKNDTQEAVEENVGKKSSKKSVKKADVKNSEVTEDNKTEE